MINGTDNECIKSGLTDQALPGRKLVLTGIPWPLAFFFFFARIIRMGSSAYKNVRFLVLASDGLWDVLSTAEADLLPELLGGVT